MKNGYAYNFIYNFPPTKGVTDGSYKTQDQYRKIKEEFAEFEAACGMVETKGVEGSGNIPEILIEAMDLMCSIEQLFRIVGGDAACAAQAMVVSKNAIRDYWG